jgi:ribosomal protein S6
MRFYELNYLYSCLSDTEEAQGFINIVKIAIEKEKGIFHSSSVPVKKKLGYEINHNQFAYSGTIEFDLQPDGLQRIQAQLKKDPDLLRFIISKKKKVLKQKRAMAAHIKDKKIKDREIKDREIKDREIKVQEIKDKVPVLQKPHSPVKDSHKKDKEKIFKQEKPYRAKIEKIKIDEINKKLDELLGQ